MVSPTVFSYPIIKFIFPHSQQTPTRHVSGTQLPSKSVERDWLQATPTQAAADPPLSASTAAAQIPVPELLLKIKLSWRQHTCFGLVTINQDPYSFQLRGRCGTGGTPPKPTRKQRNIPIVRGFPPLRAKGLYLTSLKLPVASKIPDSFRECPRKGH